MAEAFIEGKCAEPAGVRESIAGFNKDLSLEQLIQLVSQLSSDSDLQEYMLTRKLSVQIYVVSGKDGMEAKIVVEIPKSTISYGKAKAAEVFTEFERLVGEGSANLSEPPGT